MRSLPGSNRQGQSVHFFNSDVQFKTTVNGDCVVSSAIGKETSFHRGSHPIPRQAEL